jgi:hypothetical protein
MGMFIIFQKNDSSLKNVIFQWQYFYKVSGHCTIQSSDTSAKIGMPEEHSPSGQELLKQAMPLILLPGKQATTLPTTAGWLTRRKKQ